MEYSLVAPHADPLAAAVCLLFLAVRQGSCRGHLERKRAGQDALRTEAAHSGVWLPVPCLAENQVLLRAVEVLIGRTRSGSSPFKHRTAMLPCSRNACLKTINHLLYSCSERDRGNHRSYYDRTAAGASKISIMRDSRWARLFSTKTYQPTRVGCFQKWVPERAIVYW